MIPVTPGIALDESEIVESFVRASGPGGQHVNTTATAVQLRFDALGSVNLPDAVKARLPRLAGRRMTQDGSIVITADRWRSQARNRADALERLLDLIRQAAVRPAVRRATRPTLASQRRRLDAKARRGATKAHRRDPPE